jgi:hypothetical protein
MQTQTQVQTYPSFKTYQQHFVAKFSEFVAGKQFLYKTNLFKDALVTTFLESFPGTAGDNYTGEGGSGLRQWMNCQCCKNFVGRYGDLIAIENGQKISIWDFLIEGAYDEAYQNMGQRLSDLVHSAEITDVFVLDDELNPELGTLSNTVLTEDKTGVVTYNHFYGRLSEQVLNAARKKARQSDASLRTAGGVRNYYRTAYECFVKGGLEINLQVAKDVLEFHKSGGFSELANFAAPTTAYIEALESYQQALNPEIWLWDFVANNPGLARFPSTVTGQLLKDLTAANGDAGLEKKAFREFCSRVSPDSYQRKDITLVTPAQVAQAEKTVKELGIEQSLYRKHVVAEDLRLSDLGEWFWINSAIRKSGAFDSIGVFDDLKKEVGSSVVDPNKVSGKEVGLADFLSNHLGSEVEILFTGNLSNHLMSLIGPKYPEAPNIVNWSNSVTWQYAGGFTDSVIRQRVTEAGGKTDGYAVFSLGWGNLANNSKPSDDDLDLHMLLPGGYHVYHGTRAYPHRETGAKLDVDMNAGGLRDSDKPVENIYLPEESRLLEGTYKLYVKNYSWKMGNTGFVIDVKIGDQTLQLVHDRPIQDSQIVDCLEFTYSRSNGIKIVKSLNNVGLGFSTSSREIWGIQTNNWVPVKLITKSPNRWCGSEVGPEHVFFFLLGCKNKDTNLLGLTQEFLRQDLKTQHSRVFQLLMNRMLVEDADAENQLSGLGFSTAQSGKGEWFFAKADGKVYKVEV